MRKRADLTAVRSATAVAVAFLLASTVLSPAGGQSLQDLNALSLEELSDVQITSVSKRPESLAKAAASIFVITNEDIRRSGR